MRAILFITLAMMAIGCTPCRRFHTSTTDSVRVEVHTKIERIPDTLLIEVPAEVTQQTVRDTSSHLETSFAVSDARIYPDGSLFHSLRNKAQQRPVYAEKEIVYRDSVVYRNRLIKKTVPVEKKLTRWQKIQMRGFWIILVLLLLTCGRSLWRIVRKFI